MLGEEDLTVIWDGEFPPEYWKARGKEDSRKLFQIAWSAGRFFHQCGAKDPGPIGWVCTRFKNHTGSHVACSFMKDYTSTFYIAQWPSQPTKDNDG